uniref:Protein TIC 214 n=1 Tax=Gastrodia elata f. elata TaxID=2996546 RepID=A0AAU7E4A5_9ASPA
MFLIGNQILLFMKTSVIVIVIGLYYGFLTVFSIGPSFIFLIRSRVMEEGTEKEVSATTGFIAGQLLNFIAIYYTPLYKTLDRPHLITILVIPYIFFILFYANNKKDSDYLKSNSIHNLSIQFAFFTNLSSQLLNHFILPSSALNRLVNIYLFQYNNKILFLTSSFCGWLIGHFLFLKNIGSILVWIKHNYYFRYQRNKYILSNKYILTEFRNDINRIFSIFFFLILVFYLGRMPLPFFTRKLLDTEEVKIIKDEYLFEINSDIKEKETDDIKIRYLNDTQIYKDSNLEITKNIKNILEVEEDKIKINLWFENIFITFLFDYKRWNRPLRYIKNYKFDNFFRKEMSQFFFFTCTNDGKKRISFTYPYSLSLFLENMYKKNYLYISEKFSDEYIFNSWIYTNEKKKSNLDNEILKRIKKIEINNNSNTKEKENRFNILEKRTLLCDDKNQIKYLPNLYDPFFNGPNRINRNKLLSISYQDIDNKSVSGRFLINNIYNILSNYYFKLSHNLVFSSNREISYNMEKSIFSYPENTIKYFKFLFDLIREYEELIKNKYFLIRLNKINKYISRWSYKLKERLEEEEEENEDEFEEEGIVDINSRKFKHIIIYKDNNQDTNDILIADNLKNKDKNEDRIDEVTLIHYSNKSDFRRNLIKGSMRAQRRKIVILDLFQVNAHSPLFLDRLTTTFYINEIENILNILFNKFIDMKMEKKLHLKFYDFKKLNVKEKEYKDKYEHKEINETWDNPLFTQVIRSLMLVIQSYFRKYILLPFLIIVKNLLRILLFQIPEWDKDFKEWAKEMHIKCTYNGVQLSETEFPEDWLIEGIQIKIIYPFCLKPCRRDKKISYNIERERKKKKNKRPQSFFLTVWGGETEHLFGSTRKQSFILNPIYKKLKKKYKIVKNIFLEIKYFLKNKIFYFLKVSKKKENIFYESSVLSQTKNGFNSYLFQLNITDVSDKVRKIRKQTEQIVKEKNSKIQYYKDEDYKDEVLKSYINFWMILINKKRRLIRKSYYFIKLFIEKLYIDILKLIKDFFDSKKSFINFKISIYKEKKEKDVLYEITKNTRNFILIIKEIFLNNRYIDKIKNNYPNFNSIFSYFSQAYVFYKLSQDQPHSFIFIKPFKNNYKESCILENIFIYKLKNTKYNKINTDVTNYWKYWFKGFFKSKIEEKVRLGNYERYNLNYSYNLNKSKELIKTDKDYFIKDYYKLDYLVKKNISKYTKNYRYDILLNKYIGNYISTLIIKIKRKKKGQEIKENFNKSKYNLFYTYLNRYIPYNTKKIRSDNTINRTNLLYKKYFDYKSIHFNWINSINKNLISISNFKPWFFTEFVINFDVYKKKPWIIPIKSLLFNIYKKSKSTNKNIIIYKDLIRLESKSSMESGQDVNNKGVELDFFLKNSLLFQLRWVDYLNKRIIKNIKVYCLLLRIRNPKDIYISSIQRSEIKIDDMLIQKDLVTAEFINNGILFFEPIFISIQKGGEHILYQVLDISLNNKNNRKCRISDNYKNKEYINNKSTNNYFFNVEKKNNYEVLFPENILSLKRRREFRFRSCLNPFNISNKNQKFCNDKIIRLNLSKDLLVCNKLRIYFIHLKMFLWPNYRLEDIACINRYWFNTNNSSRFSMLKINMYSKLRKSIIIDK